MIKWFIKTFPHYYKMMRECSYAYDNTSFNSHHLEGDVWTFTMLSYKQGTLNNVSIYILWALLLQDIGRIITRKENHKGSYVSFGDFEGVSCFLAYEILQKTDLKKNEIIRILKIISYQYSIIDYLHSDKPVISVLLKKFLYEEELLKDLSIYIKCNFEGRIVDEDKINLYDTKKVDSLIARLSTITKSIQPYLKKEYTATILVGPPCSQKSTWISANNQNTFIVNRDKFTLEVGKRFGKLTFDSADKYLLANDKYEEEADNLYSKEKKYAISLKTRNITIDNPNMQIGKRVKWIDAYKDTHEINIVVFIRSYESLLDCDKQRSQEIQKTMGKNVIIKKLKEFYMPLRSEGFDSISYLLM